MWFSAEKGYGFLQPEGTESREDQVFVHQTQIKMEGYRQLSESQAVTFEIMVDDKGRRQAVDVIVV